MFYNVLIQPSFVKVALQDGSNEWIELLDFLAHSIFFFLSNLLPCFVAQFLNYSCFLHDYNLYNVYFPFRFLVMRLIFHFPFWSESSWISMFVRYCLLSYDSTEWLKIFHFINTYTKGNKALKWFNVAFFRQFSCCEWLGHCPSLYRCITLYKSQNSSWELNFNVPKLSLEAKTAG